MSTNLKYFDAHSHLIADEFQDDVADVLARMEEHRVGTITVGVDKATSAAAVAFAEKHKNIYATIGLHPTDTSTEMFDDAALTALVDHPKVVGVGECGLDYFRITGDIEAEKKRQRLEFEKQIVFAIDHLKPLMLHCRPSKGTMDAYEDALDMLEPVKGAVNGNVHFFVGDVRVARRFYTLNFTTSFTGVITFAREYDDVVRFAPVDMVLTETDSPYAAPAPHRGKRNDPTNVRFVVAALAEITGLPEDKLAEQVVENAKRVFAIP
jgi:TatD DNase family protein